MGGNGEMHAQVVCMPPILLSLYVNTRSWSQPFYVFPRQPRCRRANSDHAPRYSIRSFLDYVEDICLVVFFVSPQILNPNLVHCQQLL